ncbi:MAG: YaiI/YqxD family protein [Desulfobulbaceae bacterium]|nr:YaiI/YqxD family protein [Desulfobulbaceae bacterium]
MNIWIDGDACPKQIKEILFRAAERLGIPLTFVSNKLLRIPPSNYIKTIVVSAGFDVADNKIVKLMQPGDLVITADIPLAAEVIGKEGHALNPRGEFYSKESIGERLAMRNFMADLRDTGVVTGGPAALSPRDVQKFANRLDRFLTIHL